ncbi:MAG: hypothetical protein ACE5FK_00260 [Candidatus Methylomirabilia bacterium]
MLTLPKGSWQHPWLQVERVLRAILTERWDEDCWAQLESEIPAVLAAKSQIKRAGWFN